MDRVIYHKMKKQITNITGKTDLVVNGVLLG